MRSDQLCSCGHASGSKPSSLPIIIAGRGAARSPMISALPSVRRDASKSRAIVARTSDSHSPTGARREAAGDEVAPRAVLGVVEADERGVGRDVGPVPALALVRVDEELGVLLDVLDVVVARDPPELVGRVPVHRLVLAQPRVGAVRVARVEGPVEEVHVHRGIVERRRLGPERGSVPC